MTESKHFTIVRKEIFYNDLMNIYDIGHSMLDSIKMLCDRRDMPYDSVRKMLNTEILEILKEECKSVNLLK
jgi:hypothetical protein